MNPGSPISAAARAPQPLRLGAHLVIAAAVGIVAPFTVLAWPFGLLLGIVIGNDEVAQAHGASRSLVRRLVRVIEVIGGFLAMLILGAIIGGFIAFLIVALAAFSERVAGDASPIDRGLARILLFVGGALGWIVIGIVLGVHVNFHLGA